MNQSFKIGFSALVPKILLVICAISLFCGSRALADDTAHRTITDRTGRQVRIPKAPRHVACLFGPSYEKLLALGATDRISMVANVALLSLKTDLVIYHPFAKQIERMSAAGLPVVVAYDGSRRLHTLEDFLADWYDQMRFYDQVLGGTAKETAEAYCTYADKKIRNVTKKTTRIPESGRPKVFWFCGQVNGPIGTQTRHATADWIVTAAGGTGSVRCPAEKRNRRKGK